MTIIFIILSITALTGAISAIFLKNLIYAVYSLLLLFVAIAGIFLMLMAEFLAVVQILVYLGAIGILVLFGVMMTRNISGASSERILSRGWFFGLVISVLMLFGVLIPGLAFSELSSSPAVETITPSVKEIGIQLMHLNTPALWLTAVLLTAALIGAVVVAVPRNYSSKLFLTYKLENKNKSSK